MLFVDDAERCSRGMKLDAQSVWEDEGEDKLQHQQHWDSRHRARTVCIHTHTHTHTHTQYRVRQQFSSICSESMGVNATWTLGSQVERRRRENRGAVGAEGGGLWGWAVPLPRKFMNFSSQNGVIWCRWKWQRLAVFRSSAEGKNKTPVEILGVATPATPAALTPMSEWPLTCRTNTQYNTITAITKQLQTS